MQPSWRGKLATTSTYCFWISWWKLGVQSPFGSNSFLSAFCSCFRSNLICWLVKMRRGSGQAKIFAFSVGKAWTVARLPQLLSGQHRRCRRSGTPVVACGAALPPPFCCMGWLQGGLSYRCNRANCTKTLSWPVCSYRSLTTCRWLVLGSIN